MTTEDTVAEVLATAARRFGHKPLVVARDRTLTFAQLAALSADLCGQLPERGIQPGQRVTLWMENGWRWMVWYFALAEYGAVVNPCNIQLTPAEVSYIAKDCGAAAIVAAAAQMSLLAGTDLSGPNGKPRVLDGDLESKEAPVVMSTRGVDVLPHSVWTIAYTSGTTGRPKGALLRHSSIVLNTAMTALMHGRTERDTVVSALPCTHVYGNIVMNAAVMQGMTLILLPRFDERTVLQAIQDHRATMFDGVPAMYLRLLNSPELERFDVSSLRLCTVGGQTMPVSKMQDVEARLGCPLLELWGMTELGGLGTTHPHTRPRRHGSIGIALPGMEAKVAAADGTAKPVPVGEAGELVVRGPLVMEGYLGDREGTDAVIESDGWLHTGDLVRQDADGYFYVVDRAKEVIVSGGYNVYPAEVERVIAQHAAVAMVAVAAMIDEVKGQSPKAFVVLKQGASCTQNDIIQHCRRQLAPYKTPKAVEFLEDLPKTSTGKILRRALATATV